MSISIHHGSNGSYKSSGVVNDWLIPAIKAGRTVVTNLRGTSTEKCFDVIEDAHKDFELIYVDTDTATGRERIARWWHWAPLGALLLLDEAGTVFPKRWRESDIAKLTLHDWQEQGRPSTFCEAFEEHRHYNWDLVLMLPNIKSLREDIRATSEGAYKHRNRAVFGAIFKGSYLEGFHYAHDQGTSPSHFLTVQKKRIKDDRTFKLYQSTKTGNHKDTTSTTSLFSNGRLMVALVAALGAFGFVGFSVFDNGGIIADSTTINKGIQKDNTLDIKKSNFKDSPVSNIVASSDKVIKTSAFVVEHPFKDYSFNLNGSIQNDIERVYSFTLIKDGGLPFYLSSNDLENSGYTVNPVSDCIVAIRYANHQFTVTCNSLIFRI